MTAIIEVEHLTKCYGSKRGIRDVSFQVEEGEVFGFLGPNGAGKTTTIRTLMALLKADAGTARIARLDSWQDSVAIKKLVGYAPGEPALDPNLTGGQILEYFGHLRGGVDQAFLKALIKRLDLDPSRPFRQYSRGNKRLGGVAELKEIQRHFVTITFADRVPVEVFTGLAGVEQVEPQGDGRTLRLTVSGSPDAVVKAAAQHPILSLSSHEPSLEDIFLRYYEGDGPAVKEVQHVVR